jgi:trehalose 6-phosphate phosphatase
VPAPTAETIAQTLAPLTESPAAAGLFFDVDGTLAPIVARPEESRVPEKTSRLLGALARRYGAVGCISGRSAAEARRLVGVGGIAYAGSHGAELLEPGATTAAVLPEFESWAGRVREFVAARDDTELKLLRIRIEDKGPIMAFHWRGAPDDAAAHARLDAIARDAEDAGLWIHWGRKVLEIRPPVPVDKGRAIIELVRRGEVRAALFAGDDVTDLDAFEALDSLAAEGTLDRTVKVGVASDEGPPEIAERSDLTVGGVAEFTSVLEALADV